MKNALLLLTCLIIVLLIGYVDLLTGPFFHFTIFYLIPIAAAAWFINRRSGMFLLAVSACIWVLNDRLFSATYAHPVIPYWNLLLRILIFGFFIQILSSLQEALKREKTLATTDFLTGIANRRQFFELGSKDMDRCRRYSRPISSIYIDIDNFKSINDIYGHKTGDALLSSVGAALKGSTRAIDLAARVGGDEFAVVLPEADYEGGRLVVARIQNNLREAARARNLPATFSIGAVTCANPSCDFETIVAMSDIMMYTAKKEGKNRVRHEIFDDAIKRDEVRKELSLRYQA